jgi:LysR family transcriptional regulator for metE and metH
MNLAIHHFSLVNTIVQEGTLTRAAEKLHLTQSALSHQLKELEKELGIPVFYRKGKKLQLSGEGARFLKSAQKILSELTVLENDMNHLKNGESGTLKIITQCYTAYHWLPGIIKNYKKISPGVDIHILSAATYLPLEYLVKGELDIAIIRNKMSNPVINYEPLFEDQLFVIVSAEHPLARKRNIKITDFEGEELFFAYNDPATGNVPVIETLLKQNQVKPKHIHRIHYTDAIIELVNANLGVSVLADWIVQPYLETKDIRAIKLPPEVSKRTWYAATCRQTPAINNFLACLKQHFTSLRRTLDEKENQQQANMQPAQVKVA